MIFFLLVCIYIYIYKFFKIKKKRSFFELQQTLHTDEWSRIYVCSKWPLCCGLYISASIICTRLVFGEQRRVENCVFPIFFKNSYYYSLIFKKKFRIWKKIVFLVYLIMPIKYNIYSRKWPLWCSGHIHSKITRR